MLFSKVLITLSAATLVVAYAVPSGAEDGSYVAFKIDGKDIHLTMEEYTKQYPQPAELQVTKSLPVIAEVSSASEGSQLTKRAQWMFCGCGYHMVDWETDRAVGGLEDQFKSGLYIKPGLAFYTIRGPVVAFVCSRALFHLRFSPEEISMVFRRITSRCGFYIAGSERSTYDRLGSSVQGYMRYNGNGHDFCAESTGSPQDSC